MSDTTTRPPSGGTREREPHAAGRSRPLSSDAWTIAAVVLVLLNLAVLVWGIAHLSGRHDNDAGAWYSSISTQAPEAAAADPETCWLLGVVAEDAGKGSLVSGLALRDGAGDCARAAAQGANGQQLSIP